MFMEKSVICGESSHISFQSSCISNLNNCNTASYGGDEWKNQWNKLTWQILGRPISGTLLVSRRVALNPYPVAHLLIPKHHQSKNSQRCAHVQFYHFKFWFEQLQQCNMEVEHARFDELCTYYRWWLFPYPFGKKNKKSQTRMVFLFGSGSNKVQKSLEKKTPNISDSTTKCCLNFLLRWSRNTHDLPRIKESPLKTKTHPKTTRVSMEVIVTLVSKLSDFTYLRNLLALLLKGL